MLQQLAEDPFRPESASQQFSQMPQPYFAVQYTTWGQITAIGGYYDLNDAAFLSQVIQEAAASDADTGRPAFLPPPVLPDAARADLLPALCGYLQRNHDTAAPGPDLPRSSAH